MSTPCGVERSRLREPVWIRNSQRTLRPQEQRVHWVGCSGGLVKGHRPRRGALSEVSLRGGEGLGEGREGDDADTSLGHGSDHASRTRKVSERHPVGVQEPWMGWV